MATTPTIQLNGRSDWTLMPAIHDALRRDLDELQPGPPRTVRVVVTFAKP
jgi:hypothetical protein